MRTFQLAFLHTYEGATKTLEPSVIDLGQTGRSGNNHGRASRWELVPKSDGQVAAHAVTLNSALRPAEPEKATTSSINEQDVFGKGVPSGGSKERVLNRRAGPSRRLDGGEGNSPGRGIRLHVHKHTSGQAGEQASSVNGE